MANRSCHVLRRRFAVASTILADVERSSVERMKQRAKPPFADVRTCISLVCVSCLSTIHKWLRDTPRKHDLFERFHRRPIYSRFSGRFFEFSSRYVSVFVDRRRPWMYKRANVENAFDNLEIFVDRMKTFQRVSCHFEMCLRGQIPCNVVYVMYVYLSTRNRYIDRKYIDNKEIVNIRIDRLSYSSKLTHVGT